MKESILGVHTYNTLLFFTLVYCKFDLVEIDTVFIVGAAPVLNIDIETDPLYSHCSLLLILGSKTVLPLIAVINFVLSNLLKIF